MGASKNSRHILHRDVTTTEGGRQKKHQLAGAQSASLSQDKGREAEFIKDRRMFIDKAQQQVDKNVSALRKQHCSPAVTQGKVSDKSAEKYNSKGRTVLANRVTESDSEHQLHHRTHSTNITGDTQIMGNLWDGARREDYVNMLADDIIHEAANKLINQAYMDVFEWDSSNNTKGKVQNDDGFTTVSSQKRKGPKQILGANSDSHKELEINNNWFAMSEDAMVREEPPRFVVQDVD